MNRKRRAGITRFAFATIVAFLATVALLFLMTRLILPGEYHPIVTRTIQNIRFESVDRSLGETDAPVFEMPQAIAKEPRPTRANSSPDFSHQIETKETRADDSLETEGHVREFDWQRERRRLAQASDDAAFKRWLLEQGHERYASIMQGPLPITNSVRAKLSPTQEDITGYVNVYGDKEYKIGENCVATTQMAARLDQSDFARALPMVISCRRPLKQTYTFDRRGRE